MAGQALTKSSKNKSEGIISSIWGFLKSYIALILGSNADILGTNKALDTLRGLFAVLVQVGQRSITLAVGSNAYILHTLKLGYTILV